MFSDCNVSAMNAAIAERLVECTQLQRAIDTVYSTYLPKGMSPFLYIRYHIYNYQTNTKVTAAGLFEFHEIVYCRPVVLFELDVFYHERTNTAGN